MTASPPELTPPPREDVRTRRLIGVDIARFVAVLGMFVIHFGAPFLSGTGEARAAQFASGRATALFTVLAGVSLALLSGRGAPLRGTALRTARTRIAVRAVLLVVLGIALAWATAPAGFLLTVIIPFYGMYFLLAVPFVGLGARGLVIAASVAALVGPQLSFLLRSGMAADTPLALLVDSINAVDPGHLLAASGVFDLLLLGFYPAASYLPLVLAGLAVGRLDLRSGAVRLRLGLVGTLLAVGSAALSQALVEWFGVDPEGMAQGAVPVDHPEWLLAGVAHSGTTFELAGSGGIALVVLAMCLELADRTGRVLLPLAWAGSMALTLYALHALVMTWQIVVGGWVLGSAPEFLVELASLGPAMPELPDLPDFPRDGHRPEGVMAWVHASMPELFLLFSLVFAAAWHRRFRRGPLEGLVSEAVARVTTALTRAPAAAAPEVRAERHP
ncbi:heparan-alpha-glucosaminide N-acetyltransferase domain-containing protein [Saccharopolyspora sp. CA-218241]|uniref:heparan-alpha-glucosaminide N-acetyltransferase domain-containing protein n=1 Tax=Saccharopolyspora sp. CA-218241 TaxID=3240027 RepID=UPI003D9892F1